MNTISDKKISIAIIDDGINGNYFKNINFKSYVVNNDCIYEDNICGNQYTHSTVCMKILIQNLGYEELNKIEFISIKILKNNCQGNIEDLLFALNWIKQQKINVVNLSLGTCYFKEALELKKCINDLYNNNIIVVSAQNNNDMLTFPASFTNVIGVKARNCKNIKLNSNVERDGIEFSVNGSYQISIGKEIISTSNSNSYSTAYLTSCVINILLNNTHLPIKEIKNKLCKDHKQIEKYKSKFDWGHRCIIISFEKMNFINKHLYFDLIEIIYCKFFIDFKVALKDIFDKDYKIDTLIIIGKNSKYINYTMDSIHDINCKNIVLINLSDEYPCEIKDNRNRFEKIWSKHNLLKEQAFKINRPNDKIEILIPVIKFFGNDIEQILNTLINTRNQFYENGYNCKCYINSDIGILYDMDIISKYIFEKNIEKDVEYENIDIIIIGILEEKNCTSKDMFEYINDDCSFRVNNKKSFYEKIVQKFK